MSGNFDKGIDAAVRWRDDFVYLFKDNKAIRYIIGKGVDPSFFTPRDISTWNLPPPFDKGIDAAVRWGGDFVYLFKDNKAIRYIIGKGIDPAFTTPRDISTWNLTKKRDLKFFVTADPQYDNHNGFDVKNNMEAEKVMAYLVGKLNEEDVRGLIIAGDLTANARREEFDWYKDKIKGKEHKVYDGLGNHDYEDNSTAWRPGNKDVSEEIRNHVRRSTRNNTVSVDHASCNYSWDWDDVHFVQLNLYAGDDDEKRSEEVKKINGHRLNNSLTWLKDNLKSKVGTSNRPVVIIQHFGLDSFSVDDKWWTDEEQKNLLDALESYNVIAMFTGHLHSDGDVNKLPIPWSRPSSTKTIKTYVAGGARDSGYYLRVIIRDSKVRVKKFQITNSISAVIPTLGLNPDIFHIP